MQTLNNRKKITSERGEIHTNVHTHEQLNIYSNNELRWPKCCRNRKKMTNKKEERVEEGEEGEDEDDDDENRHTLTHSHPHTRSPTLTPEDDSGGS